MTDKKRRTPEPSPADWFGITSTLPGTHGLSCWRWHQACAYRVGRCEARHELAEAKAKVKRLERERDEARRKADQYRQALPVEVQDYWHWRHRAEEARAEVNTLRAAIAEAQQLIHEALTNGWDIAKLGQALSTALPAAETTPERTDR